MADGFLFLYSADARRYSVRPWLSTELKMRKSGCADDRFGRRCAGGEAGKIQKGAGDKVSAAIKELTGLTYKFKV